MHERPGETGYVSLADEPHCPVCEAVMRYCPSHGSEGRAHGQPMPIFSTEEGERVNSMRAGGNWGYFSGDPIARWSPDGKRMILMEDFSFVDRRISKWTSPKGSTLDGASIPRPFWSLVGSPYRGKYRYASIIHDYHCVARVKPWRSVHFMFYEACMASGTGHTHAKILYYAVRHFGPRWGGGYLPMGLHSGRIADETIEDIERWIATENPSLSRIDGMEPDVFGVIATQLGRKTR